MAVFGKLIFYLKGLSLLILLEYLLVLQPLFSAATSLIIMQYRYSSGYCFLSTLVAELQFCHLHAQDVLLQQMHPGIDEAFHSP